MHKRRLLFDEGMSASACIGSDGDFSGTVNDTIVGGTGAYKGATGTLVPHFSGIKRARYRAHARFSGDSPVSTKTDGLGRGGFEPPVPRGLLWAGIRPEFGALSARQKAPVLENLFALGFGFASALSGSLRSPRLNADARRRRRSDQKLPVQIRAPRSPSPGVRRAPPRWR